MSKYLSTRELRFARHSVIYRYPTRVCFLKRRKHCYDQRKALFSIVNTVLTILYWLSTKKCVSSRIFAVYYLIRERISPKNAIEFAVVLEKQYAKVLISRIWISKSEKFKLETPKICLKILIMIFWKYKLVVDLHHLQWAAASIKPAICKVSIIILL